MPPSDFGAVDMYIDTARRPVVDLKTIHVRDGRPTADTLLDRVVFGEPIMADDMWQLRRIHEVSRRRNGECGLDVIVASATRRQGANHTREPILTAEEAAQTLVQLARKLDPDGALATHAVFEDVPQTAEIAGVDEDLRLRAPDLARLQPFEAGMRAFLKKARSVQDIQTAEKKRHIWRGSYAVDASFASTLKEAFPWCKPLARVCCCACAPGGCTFRASKSRSRSSRQATTRGCAFARVAPP